MIVDDSLSRFTTRMIVHDSFWSAVFPENRWARKFLASATASEIRVYIENDNHDKENIEDRDNIEEISSEDGKRQLASLIRRDTAKKKRITKRFWGKMSNAARWSND